MVQCSAVQYGGSGASQRVDRKRFCRVFCIESCIQGWWGLDLGRFGGKKVRKTKWIQSQRNTMVFVLRWFE